MLNKRDWWIRTAVAGLFAVATVVAARWMLNAVDLPPTARGVVEAFVWFFLGSALFAGPWSYAAYQRKEEDYTRTDDDLPG